MGILVENNEERTGLESKITADLRQRSEENSLGGADLVEDSAYLDGTQKTTAGTIFWFTIVALVVLSLIVIFALK